MSLIVDVLQGNGIIGQSIKDKLNQETSGFLANGATKQRPNETPKAYENRMLKSLAAAIETFNHTSHTIRGVETSLSPKQQFKIGAIHSIVKRVTHYIVLILLVSLLFKKSN